MTERKTTTIGVPKGLKKRFESLNKDDSYKSFTYFCNIAITAKIEKLENEKKGG